MSRVFEDVFKPAMARWSFPDSAILLSCELEGALNERLSPSLKRAKSDILGWFMAFVKVIIAKDPEMLALRKDITKVNFQLAEIYEPALENLIPGAKTTFSYHRNVDGEDKFLLYFRNLKVPDYWRLPTTKTLEGHLSFKVIRGGERKTVFSSGAFGQGEKIYILELDAGVRTPLELVPNCLPALKGEVVATIYHELQHFYQTTPGAAVAHKFSPEELERYQSAVGGKGDPRHYFLAPIEVDAVSTSLYRLARNRGTPLENLIALSVAQASSGSLMAGRKDPEFSRDYAQALIDSLEKKYPQTRGRLNLRRVLEKELKYWHGAA